MGERQVAGRPSPTLLKSQHMLGGAESRLFSSGPTVEGAERRVGGPSLRRREGRVMWQL